MQTRRQWLARSGAAAAVAVLAPQADALAAGRRSRAGLMRGGRFAQGVLSGDPAPTAITLLTLLDDAAGAGRVRVEVARDPGFRRVVARRDILTTSAIGHSVKARVTGLEPHERYWYRFETRDRNSPVGRFTTAPAPDSNAPVRFGFFSCADYTHGYFNAYERLAGEDLDFVVCLGDYIYAEAYATVADGRAVRDDPIGRENAYYAYIRREAATLREYRAKYALYRTDPALRALHAAHPVVAIWDDHEVLNNYANGADNGGLPLRAGFARARRDAAVQAYFESMPVFPRGRSRIYRAQRHGRTLELLLLDERQYRDNQPCGDAIALPCSTWDRDRTMLGRRQLAFVEGRLASSRAAWKLVAGQSLMMPNRVHDGEYQRFDSWQGYPRERAHLLRHITDQSIRDVVFLTGDVHTVMAGDVRTEMGAGPSVAVEFAPGSVTAATPGEANYRLPGKQLIPGNNAAPAAPPGVVEHYRAINPWLGQIDLDHHGYGVATASRDAFHVTLNRLWTIKERGNVGLMPTDGFHWKLARGQTSILG